MPEIATKSEGPAPRVGDRLRAAARARLRGRARELAWLERALIEDESAAVFVHGIGGIGKTSLLDAAEPRLEARGGRCLRFDGHEVEPTPEGFLFAVGAALGASRHELEDVVAALGALPDDVVILAFDEYDALRLLDAWLRRVFLPALPSRVRMLFVGRSRPVAAWTAAPGWDALVRSLELGPMSEEESALVVGDVASPALREKICAIGKGHPLALRLAATAVAARPELPLAELESRHVVGELVARFLSDIDAPEERAAIEAASVLRRVTRPLLARILGDAEAERALATLSALPFVETGVDGLVVHQSVRTAVASTLRSLDPVRHRELRTRAWSHLAEELRRDPRTERNWGLMADVLYLVDDASVREAFFPTDTIRLGVEPAAPSDGEAILAIARVHAGEGEARVLAEWWEHLPEAFVVVRSDSERVLGFHAVAFEAEVPEALLADDPLLARWSAHAKATFPRNGRPVIFSRAMLSRAHGTRACEERAACFHDLKRSYMEHLDLAAIYTAHYDGSEAQLCDRFGFAQAPSLTYEPEAGRAVTTAVLDFGPGVLSWLGRLLDAQWEQAEGSADPRPYWLCRDGRGLVVDGQLRPLTRLEFGLMDHLERRAGAVASRDELLESVWGQTHTGSNVVDAVVRSLRKKLGPYAGAIETVTGHGYRFRAA